MNSGTPVFLDKLTIFPSAALPKSMAQASLAAPLRRYCSQHLFSSFKPRHFLFPFSRTSSYNLSQARALRPVVFPSDGDAIDWEEERSKAARLADRKSRNELKREARRAVQWGVELSKFSPSQIKRALKVASLEKEVYEALMLVKRLGPDVREGKRRQFNYIGSLLRNAEPEVMDTLIQAYKDGDTSRLHSLTAKASLSTEGEEEEEIEEASDEDEVVEDYVQVATRWLEGLICNDPSITKEVYGIHNVEFDRQELRRLVRKVQLVQEDQSNDDAAALMQAKRPLMRLLRSLSKRTYE